jgi:hypothetical protein
MTPSRGDLRDQLREVAARAVPGPNPGFVAGLGARLTHWSFELSPVIPLRRRARPAVLRPVATGVAAAASALVLAGSFAGRFDGDPGAPTRTDALELAAAFDTVVVLPGGDQVPGAAGLRLPHAAVVRTGPNGSATVGSVELGPRQEAVVDAGELRVRSAPAVPVGATLPTTASAPATTSTPPTTRPTPTTSRPMTTTTNGGFLRLLALRPRPR